MKNYDMGLCCWLLRIHQWSSKLNIDPKCFIKTPSNFLETTNFLSGTNGFSSRKQLHEVKDCNCNSSTSFCFCSELTDQGKKLGAFREALCLLPPSHSETLRYLMAHLKRWAILCHHGFSLGTLASSQREHMQTGGRLIGNSKFSCRCECECGWPFVVLYVSSRMNRQLFQLVCQKMLRQARIPVPPASATP